MPVPATTPDLGFAHFLSHADGVAITILVIMTVMSVVSWAIISIKSIRHYLERRRSAHFERYFWEAPSLAAIQAHVKADGVNDPFSHMTAHGFRAIEQFSKKDGGRMVESGSADEFLTRSLRRAYEQETSRREAGLTFLASVGSSAPFVGLFGTVWGIYHALLAIGMSGQGTLDKVAGPVGEALIMTALGLAVAIPAVLAYNTFTRQNRVILAQLDGFAHDLFAFMSTGNRAGVGDLHLVGNTQTATVKAGV